MNLFTVLQARICKRLTTEWFATSVNLPKWASSQISATAPALNNSQYCTSVLFLFHLPSPLSTVRSPNHCNCIFRRCCIFLFHLLIKGRLLGIGDNNKNGKRDNLFSHFSPRPHGDIKAMHFTVIDFPACAHFPLLRPYWVSQPIKVIISLEHFIVHHRDILRALIRSVMTTAASETFQSDEMVPFEQSLLFIALPFPASNALFFFFILWYNDFNIPLTASLLVCWAGSRRFHQRSCAWHSSSKVCPGNRQLYTHLHLLGMPTGWTSTSSYPHCYFWLAYNASITSLSLNRKATASFVSKATMKSAGGRSKLVWQWKFGLWWEKPNIEQLLLSITADHNIWKVIRQCTEDWDV